MLSQGDAENKVEGRVSRDNPGMLGHQSPALCHGVLLEVSCQDFMDSISNLGLGSGAESRGLPEHVSPLL